VTTAGGTISLLVGSVLLRLAVTGDYRRYVRVGMGPWLAVAGAAVIVLGLATLAGALRRNQPVDAHGHVQHDGGRAGWLLLAPIAALLLIAPPTLGSFGVSRGATVDIRSGPGVFRPLAPSAAPVPMTLLEFGQRAFDRGGATLRGATVELTGFVAEAGGGGFRLARYQIACCAADAAPVVVDVVAVHGDLPPRDQWVVVTGTLLPGGAEIPRLAATSVLEVAPPGEPYE
jgi:uncharacterized repeat protein (TIGR03943 family)